MAFQVPIVLINLVSVDVSQREGDTACPSH